MIRQNDYRPLVTLVFPAYNEAAILEDNLAEILGHIDGLEDAYRWELLIVNDGSSDGTGRIAESIAARDRRIRVLHHPSNFGLGQAFKTAFAQSRGDYVVTMDIDLSYSADHIEKLLSHMRKTSARLVLASPYMEGGKLTNVPFLRRFLSTWGNRFLAFFARGGLSTITCMVRAYDGVFIRSLVLRSTGMEIMPEVVYKAMLLRARIDQVPAHLDWSRQVRMGASRRSSMRIFRHVFRTLVSGFVFRPFLFLLLPGLFLLGFSLWVNAWMLVHFFSALGALPDTVTDGHFSVAVAQAYADHPHTFIVGLLGLMLSIQMISLGILALQSKKNFEETFYLGQTIIRRLEHLERS